MNEIEIPDPENVNFIDEFPKLQEGNFIQDMDESFYTEPSVPRYNEDNQMKNYTDDGQLGEEAFKEGQGLLDQLQYAMALEQFQKALKHFNQANNDRNDDINLCQINIDNCKIGLQQYNQAQNSLDAIHKDFMDQQDQISDNLWFELYNSLASYQLEQLNQQKSIDLYEQSLSFINKDEISKNQKVALIHYTIGIVYYSLDNYKTSCQHLTKSYEIYEQILDPNSLELAIQKNNLGEIHRLLENFDESLKYFQQALEIQKEIFPNELDRYCANSYQNIAKAYEIKQDEDSQLKAIENYKKSVQIFEKLYEQNKTPEIGIQIANSKEGLAFAYICNCDYKEAFQEAQSGYSLMAKIRGNEKDVPIRIKNTLADCHFFLEQYEKALNIFSEIEIIMKSEKEANNKALSEIVFKISICFQQLKDIQKAIEKLNQAIGYLQTAQLPDANQLDHYKTQLKQFNDSLVEGQREADQEKEGSGKNEIGEDD